MMDKEQISIHAPAKGATIPVRRIHIVPHHFNPRSREGSDIGLFDTYINHYIFQSTLPRRERRKRSFKKCAFSVISIHAPAKGATKLGKSSDA